LTDVERAGITAWLGPDHPALNVLGKVGPDLYPDSLAHHPRFRAMVAAVQATERRRVAAYLERGGEQKRINALDSVAPGFGEIEAATLREAAEWCRDDTIWDEGDGGT
jgi:hypothetical protein